MTKAVVLGFNLAAVIKRRRCHLVPLWGRLCQGLDLTLFGGKTADLQ